MTANKIGRGKAEAAARPATRGDLLPKRFIARAPSRTAYRRAPLASLRVFVAVADHKSFTRGAYALGITTSAASLQVQALEEYLRAPVLRRNGRRVELTEVGARLRPKVEQALADLERAIDEARADRGSGPLRVTTLAFFLAQWLLPRLPKFTTQHASIDCPDPYIRSACRFCVNWDGRRNSPWSWGLAALAQSKTVRRVAGSGVHASASATSWHYR